MIEPAKQPWIHHLRAEIQGLSYQEPRARDARLELIQYCFGSAQLQLVVDQKDFHGRSRTAVAPQPERQSLAKLDSRSFHDAKEKLRNNVCKRDRSNQ